MKFKNWVAKSEGIFRVKVLNWLALISVFTGLYFGSLIAVNGQIPPFLPGGTMKASDLDGKWTGNLRWEWEFETTRDGTVTMRVVSGGQGVTGHGGVGQGCVHLLNMEFTGKFNSAGFDMKTGLLSADDLCRSIPLKFRKQVVAQYANLRYRVTIKPIGKMAVLMKWFTHLFDISGSQDKLLSFQIDGRAEATFLVKKACSSSAETVKREIIERDYSDRFVLALGRPNPLPPGTEISEAFSKKSNALRVENKSCFFFVDLLPTAKYGHPVLYVLVDTKTGKITHKELAASPPIITESKRGIVTEKEYYGTLKERLFSPDRIIPETETELLKPVMRPPFRLLLPPLLPSITARNMITSSPFGMTPKTLQNVKFVAPAPPKRNPCESQSSKKVALLVNGGSNNVFMADVQRMRKLFDDLHFDIETKNWKDHSLDDVRKSIGERTKDLGECDVFVLYISSHTVEDANCKRCDIREFTLRTDGEIAYKHKFTVQTTAPFTYFRVQPWSLSNQKNNTSNSLGVETGPGLLYTLRNVKAGRINVILDSCFSELLIEAAAFKTWGGRPINRFLSTSQVITIFASSTRGQPSNALNADMKGEENIEKYGEDNAAGGLFTHRFGVQMQRLIDMDGFDKNSDGHVDLIEYDNATKLAMSIATDVVKRISREATNFSPQDPIYYSKSGTKRNR